MTSHLHLSDEALSDELARPADTAVDAETLALKAAVVSYRVETLAWAERRSATHPSLAPRAKASRWMAVPQWSLAAVAVVAVAAGVVHFAGYGAEDVTTYTDPPASALLTRAAKPDDIAADNQLLGSIDQALRYESVSPATDFGAKRSRQARPSSHAEVTD